MINFGYLIYFRKKKKKSKRNQGASYQDTENKSRTSLTFLLEADQLYLCQSSAEFYAPGILNELFVDQLQHYLLLGLYRKPPWIYKTGPCYRASNIEKEISLVDDKFCLLDEDSDSGRFLSVKNPGCLG